MIRFGTLKIRNANPYKSVDLDLRKKGLVRVVGRNGEGKSSLWHLMQFLYYGIHPNKATKSDIMMDKKNFLIEGTFEKEGVNYCVAISEKAKTHNPLGEPYGSGYFLFTQMADGWKDISNHKALDTQKMVKALLGWTIEEWQGYVYLGQQTVHKLIMGTRSERQKYLSGLFNLDPLDSIHKHYETKVVGFDQAIKDIERKQTEMALLREMQGKCRTSEVIRAAIDDSRFKTDDLSFIVGELDEEAKRFGELQEVDETLRVLRTTLAIEGDGSALEQKVQGEIEDGVRAGAEYQVLTSQREKAKFKRDQTFNQVSTLNLISLPNNYADIMQAPDISLEADEAELRRLNQYKTSLRVTEKPATELPANKDEVLAYPDIDQARTRREIESIKARPAPPADPRPDDQDLDDLRMDLSGAKATITQLRARQKQLSLDSSSCPTCGSELNPEHRKAEQERVAADLLSNQQTESQVTTMLAQMTRIRDQWVAYEALGPDRSAEIPELESQLTRAAEKASLKVLIQQHEAFTLYEGILKQIEEIPAIEKRVSLYREKLKCREISDKLKERDLLQTQLTQLDIEVQELADKVTVLGKPVDTDSLKTQLESIRKARTLIQRREVLAASNPEDVEAQCRMKHMELEEAQKETGKLETELKQAEDLNRQIETLMQDTMGHEDILREKKKCELICKAYGKAGKIRELQLSRFTRYLDEALTCHTFQHLPKHQIHFTVGDGIGLDTSKEGCRPYDVSMMSGGEKGSLSGALMFALDDLQAPDRRTSLKIIDELEAAFDPERKQEFLDTMLPALRDRAETVIVISHTPVLDKTIFDRTWKVSGGSVEDVSGEIRERA